MARYGHHDEVPYKETYECRPQDPYGIAKKAGEDVLRNLYKNKIIPFSINTKVSKCPIWLENLIISDQIWA